MVLRRCNCKRLFHLATLLSLLVPVLHGQVMAKDEQSSSGSHKQGVAEQVDTMQRHQDLQAHTDTKRSSQECGQERLDNLLRSCEAAASVLMPPPSDPTMATDTDSLVFCGADCSHLVVMYASECSGGEFLVNVSGACKLSGQNMTVECVYAVVLVKMGIASCIKTVVDVESTHEIADIAPTVPDFREYIDEQCCSLETLYDSVVTQEVYADTMGRPVVEPPLQPPWLLTDASDLQDVINVVSSELCLVPLPTEPAAATTTELLLTTSEEGPDTNSAFLGSTEAISGAARLLTLSNIHRPSVLACFILSITIVTTLGSL